MKNFLLIFSIYLISISAASAEIYHGIDIDSVYNNSDWSSKSDIKEFIDDYTLLLAYQSELDNCPNLLPENLHCYDQIAKKIMTNLYVYPEDNLKQYEQLKESALEAFGLKNCRQKYTWPAGNLCDLESSSNLADFVKGYIQNLITSSKEKMLIYSPILEKYR